MKNFVIRHSQTIVWSLFALFLFWGVGRLYFEVTGGFWVSNIVSDLKPNPAFNVRSPTPEETAIWNEVANRPWRYLGKGCQSYVFESENKQFVLKFFKHQRFRNRSWVSLFENVPFLSSKLRKKQAARSAKLAYFMRSWQIAFNDLPIESEVVRVHLNKTKDLGVTFTLIDKVGLSHEVGADDVEFLIQRRAEPLAEWIEKQEQAGESEKVRKLLHDLVAMLVSEYERGLLDRDPALLQNTGVYQDRPVHMDVGQFEKNDTYKNPDLWAVELFNRTYDFRLWLHERYPAEGEYLTSLVQAALGPRWDKMKPFFGRLHQEAFTQ
jgi:hypothetical protein